MNVLKEAIEQYLTKDNFGRCDFHTHSFLSDGVLLPIEALRRAHVLDTEVYAITDHASASTLDLIPKIVKDCELATKHWGIIAIPGIELTHVPVGAMDELIQEAIDLGAVIIVIHGETISEPVEKGTNLRAAKNENVDILAHPGMLTKEEAENCKKNSIFVEITANKNHTYTNGHVAKIGKEAGVDFIQNTDTHSPRDMITYEQGEQVLLAAGLTQQETTKTLQNNVRKLLTRIQKRL